MCENKDKVEDLASCQTAASLAFSLTNLHLS